MSSRNLTKVLSEYEYIVALIPRGTTVYTTLHHVSRSGMSRNISFHVVAPDGEIRTLNGLMIALGIGSRPRGDSDGIAIGGAGMDMGFHGVYALAQYVHGDGYALSHRWL